MDSSSVQDIAWAMIAGVLIISVTWYNIVTPSEERAAIQAGLVQRVDRKDNCSDRVIWVKPEEARK